MWKNDADLGPFRYMLVILKRVVQVSIGCGAWAHSWWELHLNWTWGAGGRTLASFSPQGPKVSGPMQSKWELNQSPRAQLPWKMAFQLLHSPPKYSFSSLHTHLKPVFFYSWGVHTHTLTAAGTLSVCSTSCTMMSKMVLPIVLVAHC